MKPTVLYIHVLHLLVVALLLLGCKNTIGDDSSGAIGSKGLRGFHDFEGRTTQHFRLNEDISDTEGNSVSLIEYNVDGSEIIQSKPETSETDEKGDFILYTDAEQSRLFVKLTTKTGDSYYSMVPYPINNAMVYAEPINSASHFVAQIYQQQIESGMEPSELSTLFLLDRFPFDLTPYLPAPGSTEETALFDLLAHSVQESYAYFIKALETEPISKLTIEDTKSTYESITLQLQENREMLAYDIFTNRDLFPTLEQAHFFNRERTMASFTNFGIDVNAYARASEIAIEALIRRLINAVENTQELNDTSSVALINYMHIHLLIQKYQIRTFALQYILREGLGIDNQEYIGTLQKAFSDLRFQLNQVTNYSDDLSMFFFNSQYGYHIDVQLLIQLIVMDEFIGTNIANETQLNAFFANSENDSANLDVALESSETSPASETMSDVFTAYQTYYETVEQKGIIEFDISDTVRDTMKDVYDKRWQLLFFLIFLSY